ncbi:hypothetical protein MYCTH_2305807 [Thermothelomyces thermophilus ATCC 42464]|uniref:Uncharacterized protein n=1 Tax=Thermothelomyces thermophilus (strain ATCC 42464 / BCRC 31852 / DSM 1799) TaxID=573729 RepID=G2QFU0_THET4|nr:uncharacterized protein MYCTH_2305807 [Thermothelomyces thermophilus ATCC 42464]AEO58458.1 hypothetical protein MYCTH_2305807 [Thermothelomyces thermophilus ATCC 42464]
MDLEMQTGQIDKPLADRTAQDGGRDDPVTGALAGRRNRMVSVLWVGREISLEVKSVGEEE